MEFYKRKELARKLIITLLKERKSREDIIYKVEEQTGIGTRCATRLLQNIIEYTQRHDLQYGAATNAWIVGDKNIQKEKIKPAPTIEEIKHIADEVLNTKPIEENKNGQ